MKEIEYIGGKKERGIRYDWKAIRKEMKRLEIPADFYDPCTAPLEQAQWYVEVSERAVGKTTGWLLLGLVMHWMYGTVTIYVRSKRDMIAPKNSSSLYHVVRGCGYISRITDGRWTDIVYSQRRWYLCRTGEDGELLEKAPEYCCRMVSLDDAGDLKSSFNEPAGDLLIFDEFIPISSRYQTPNEFVSLVDFCSTAFRLRESPKIAMLANNLDKYNQYFNDLEIFERISEMQVSESCLHTTDKGTKIYIEFIGAPKKYRTKKSTWNRLFAGFRKPELASVTGEATWAVHCYQHIPVLDDGESVENLFRKIYIYYQNKYVRLDIVQHSRLGTCIYAHWAKRPYDDSIILTSDMMYDERYRYGIADGSRLGKILKEMMKERKIYFAANDVGAFIEGYFLSCGINTKLFF